MKELNMAVYTGKEGENKVTLTAAFATHAEAVKFHNGLSKLAKDASAKVSWRGRLFPYPASKDDGVGG